MIHRPTATEDGYFLFLISPRLEAPQQIIPRDLLLVLDTSGSMKGVKMDQAKKALHYFLENVNKQDRFGLMNFSTSVTTYQNELLEANRAELIKARRWVDDLETTGGTAIDKALSAALEMRTRDEGRGAAGEEGQEEEGRDGEGMTNRTPAACRDAGGFLRSQSSLFPGAPGTKPGWMPCSCPFGSIF